MFCYQCEQAAKGQGCDAVGVCGKTPDVAALQDLALYVLKGLAQTALAGRRAGINRAVDNHYATDVLFATVTNVDFDPARFQALIQRGVELRKSLAAEIRARGGAWEAHDGPAAFEAAAELPELILQGEEVGLKSFPGVPADIHSLEQLLIYGLKGMAAYATHARILGQEDDAIYAFTFEALAATIAPSLDVETWVKWVLKCGEVNLRTMELLDAANTGAYGHPVPTAVPLGHKKGKAILVSGHDLKDLDALLKQTAGTGISVYTHGEMLPAHGYPKLKAYPHFYGHFGTAWQNQGLEFAQFPGAILMTTNCIQRPRDGYKHNLFTTGLVGWPNVTHVPGPDFTPVIERALALPGFAEDAEAGQVHVGFGHNTVLGIADKIIAAVQAKDIRHFFLVGGCDGAKPGRSYYTEFVEKVPEDCVVMTLACGKFRFFDQQLGAIGGIPRLLDLGQCNDAFSAIKIALALADAFKVGVNELPLSLVLSWYEQKAVVILLTLLHLGIKGIRLGPTLPAFVTPAVLDLLVRVFDLKPITTADEDLRAILGSEPAGVKA